MTNCIECIENNIYREDGEWCGVHTVCPQAELYWKDKE